MKFKTLALCSALVTAAAVQAQTALAADGAALYGANCGICHQADGMGVPGQFPTLKERIGKIASSPEGKTYVEHVVLNGLTGSITAGGASYAGYMPTFSSQSDDDLAAILTYVASLGGTGATPTFTAAEIKAARATPVAAPALVDERKALDAKHPLP